MLQIFGTVNPPPGVTKWTSQGGFIGFLSAILQLLIIIGGIWTLINIILAGYKFLGAGGKPEEISNAWAKIWQSLLGLLFIAGAFVIAAIIGQIIFGDPTAILKPQVFTP
ncbi:hypothetical protein HYZ78_01940 [Candidatus Microgenomates bacterium]|nr:hypothetical protein [Candidatus Microgenomates bacterium]